MSKRAILLLTAILLPLLLLVLVSRVVKSSAKPLDRPPGASGSSPTLGTGSAYLAGAIIMASAYQDGLTETLWSHLPLVGLFAGESEPNNYCGQAHPVLPNVGYHFYPEDVDDWYLLDVFEGGSMLVALEDFAPVAGQIILYGSAGDCASLTFIGSNGDFSPSKRIVAGPQPAGRFFIWLINDGPPSTTDAYRLEVTVTP